MAATMRDIVCGTSWALQLLPPPVIVCSLCTAGGVFHALIKPRDDVVTAHSGHDFHGINENKTIDQTLSLSTQEGSTILCTAAVQRLWKSKISLSHRKKDLNMRLHKRT